ncbi:MAG: hypothetical protein KF842_06760 [Caulobacter sp.]|nr:hypothetical protein [Caulobacter sp.]
MWRAVKGGGVWTGGGMTPTRLDRAAVLRRTGDLAQAWVTEELLDAFEPAALGALHRTGKTRREPDDKEN